MLELMVKVININLSVGHPILERCRPLYEYAWFIQRIKDYLAVGMTRDQAIVKAMTDCETEGIMLEFLREHGTEAVNMLFTQFNMDDALSVRYAEGKEDGKAMGLLKNIENVKNSLHCDLEEACNILKITMEDYEKAKKMVDDLEKYGW